MIGSVPRNKGWHLFDAFGHPVYMQPWFLLLIAFFALMPISARGHDLFAMLSNVLVWGPTLFLGILLHELGHAAALKHFNYGSSTIVLQGFGGVTINQRRGRNPPGKAIIISLAGPFASLATAFVSYGLLLGFHQFGWVTAFPLAGVLGDFLWTMAFINMIWAIFNLLPVNPLDGGHVMLHAMRSRFGNRRKAMYYTAVVSMVVLGVVVVGTMAAGIGGFLLLAIAGMLGYQNYQILQAAKNSSPPRGPGRRM